MAPISEAAFWSVHVRGLMHSLNLQWRFHSEVWEEVAELEEHEEYVFFLFPER